MADETQRWLSSFAQSNNLIPSGGQDGECYVCYRGVNSQDGSHIACSYCDKVGHRICVGNPDPNLLSACPAIRVQ